MENSVGKFGAGTHCEIARNSASSCCTIYQIWQLNTTYLYQLCLRPVKVPSQTLLLTAAFSDSKNTCRINGIKWKYSFHRCASHIFPLHNLENKRQWVKVTFYIHILIKHKNYFSPHDSRLLLIPFNVIVPFFLIQGNKKRLLSLAHEKK